MFFLFFFGGGGLRCLLQDSTIVLIHGDHGWQVKAQPMSVSSFVLIVLIASCSDECAILNALIPPHPFQNKTKLGEHNSWHKFTNFELGVRVPLIIKHPGMPTAAGKRTNTFAELIDVYPTLADLTGSGTPGDTLDGVSLRPLFEDPDQGTIITDKGIFTPATLS